MTGGATSGTKWEAIVVADRAYFDRVAPDGVEFPVTCPPRRFLLDLPELRIGRYSQGIYPEIDLGGLSQDMAVSRLHAFLIRQDDGSYAVVDCGSANGTTINASSTAIEANSPICLADGDQIHLGWWTTIAVHALRERPGIAATTGRPTGADRSPDLAPPASIASSEPSPMWIVCTDLEGSTLLQQRSTYRYAEVMERFARRLAGICDQYRGSILSSVNGTAVISFDEGSRAARAAIAVMESHASSESGEDVVLQVRIGIHLETIRDSAVDVSPGSRHTALAVCLAGHGRQVLVSEAAEQAGLAYSLPRASSLVDLGRYRLADLARPQHVYQMVHPTLAGQFPPLRSLDDRPNNLPVHLTSFIGRRADIADLIELISDHRLCTVAGAAGVGKTRLALQVGARLLHRFPDGVWVADLAAVSDQHLVSGAVANALGIREGGSGTYTAPDRAEPRSPSDRLSDHLVDAKALVILNNCEHVSQACGEVVGGLLRDCPTLRILTTSREVLGVPGEAVYRLGRLELPARWDTVPRLRESDAVRLFVNRATLQNPHLILDEAAIEVAAEICVRVEGLPFAIELAAARTGVLALPEIAAMLEHRLDLSSDGRNTSGGSQPTLRGMMDWSHNLLSDREKVLFRRLSVFAGSFTLEAAREVCAAPGLERFEVVDLLAALVNKSMVDTEAEPGGNRYRLLETTREYADEELAPTGEEPAVRAAHLAWFQAFAEQAEAELTGADQARWLDLLEADHENLLVALETGRQAANRDDLRLAAALSHFWLVRGWLTEGAAWLDSALERYPEPADPLRAKGLCARGVLACFAGDLGRVEDVAREALRLARQQDNKSWEGRALTLLGLAASGRGRFEEAERHQLAAVTSCEDLADPWLSGFVLTNLGNVLALRGASAEAATLYGKGLALRRARHDAWGLSWVLFRLGVFTTWQGRFPEAVEFLEEALDHSRSISFGQGELLALLGLAEAFHVNGDQRAAAARYDEALSTARVLEEPTGACLALAGLAKVALARGDVSAAATWLTEEESLHADHALGTLAAMNASRALLATARGDDRGAEAMHRDVLELRRQLGDHRAMAEQLEELALVAAQRDQLEHASTLLAAANTKRRKLGLPVPPLQLPAIEALETRIAASSDAAVHAAWAEGMGLSFDAVVTLASSDAEFGIRDAGVEEVSVGATDLRQRIAEAREAWTTALHEALVAEVGRPQAAELFERYGDAFPSAYWADFPATAAVADIRHLETCQHDLAIHLERPQGAPAGFLRLKLLHSAPIALADILPLLENAGVRVLDQHPYRVVPRGADPVWIDEFGLTYTPGAADMTSRSILDLFEDACINVWQGRVEDDGFNRLVLGAGMPWRDVVLLRAFSRYLRQIGNAFSLAHMEQTLARYPDIATLLIALFHDRMDPARQSVGAAAEDIAGQVTTRIDRVTSLDEDRILRSFLHVVLATTRTNFYNGTSGRALDAISFKLDTSRVPDLPPPRPMFEIFVYSPRLEGVHLRGGKVARGGIRWSERPEDFRTEVLGLMKAQMVKNAVIVPVGAKGGFVVKNPPSEREQLAAEVKACYDEFIRALLDLTDNIVKGEVRPADIVRHDDDDPYLVVAADKGTATFSDLANGISAEYGLWLGDAFASGGSSGYDHKKIGITARGAWESARRHFIKLGVNIDHDTVTVVGIGDMSGDVFGNGMLLSRHLKLVGAFDHRHVLVDPDPDPAASFAERVRLSQLERSSWADYDPAVLSSGGGVFDRKAKSIPLSVEVQQLLAVDADRLTPDELIRLLLCGPVDLLWNGGVGTFVKGSTESHADVGDKTNDAIRVNGEDLRCRVAVEGGNLGFTQRGRVEFAGRAGLINTDAIDNSAGVDCSDHEVNIKILLNQIVAEGELSVEERDRLLAEMVDEVATAVLRDNYLQAQALARSALSAPPLGRIHQRYIQFLEQEGRLDRDLERLPTDKQLDERLALGAGLTTPELALVLAHTKMLMFDQLLASDLPEDAYFSSSLSEYFPTPMPREIPAGNGRAPVAARDHRQRRRQ